MTILVSGIIDLDPAKRDEVLRGSRHLIDGALSQPGCLAYAWTADPHDSGRVFVFEEWESEAPFAAHLAGDWYRGMLKHMQGAGIRGAVTRKHRVTLSEPVYDATGRPRADFVTD
jgi:quinol monooxygenase YgiN